MEAMRLEMRQMFVAQSIQRLNGGLGSEFLQRQLRLEFLASQQLIPGIGWCTS